jgi:hypothetical protein
MCRWFYAAGTVRATGSSRVARRFISTARRIAEILLMAQLTSPEIVGGGCDDGDVIEAQLDQKQAMAACFEQWRHSIIECDDAGLQDQVRDIEFATTALDYFQ